MSIVRLTHGHRTSLLGLALLLWTSALAGQTRFTADPQSSLAWWQVTPHMGHLWATSCPNDPSWQSGDEYSMGYAPRFVMDESALDVLVPLYPRSQAQRVCRDAVRGEIVVGDTATWAGTHGVIVVRLDSLETGYRERDTYARQRVMQTATYPEVTFRIDSLTAIHGSVRKGDTLRANAIGVLELHGVRQPWVVPIKARQEKLGLRVTGQFSFPARDLVDQYHMSKYPLSLGVGSHIWRTMSLGIDAILVPAVTSAFLEAGHR